MAAGSERNKKVRKMERSRQERLVTEAHWKV